MDFGTINPTPNLFLNGSFVDRKANWRFNTDGDATWNVPNEQTRITINVSGNRVQLYQKDMMLVPGQTYVAFAAPSEFSGRTCATGNYWIRLDD